MTSFMLGIMIGFVVGYAVGLFIDKWDKRIKNGRR
jgi:gas vesicle protein